jgi:hypothetical protein
MNSAPAQRSTLDASSRALSLLRAWADKGQSAITLASGGKSVLELWRQYPEQDICDSDTRLRIFYHCHPGARQSEHGHFHVFLDSAGGEDAAWSHLVAIALNAYGLPVRLFTVNRWVTGERWLPATQLMQRLARLPKMKPLPLREAPAAQINVFVGALLRIFEPQVRALLVRRDARTQGWSDSDFEDRRRHVLSACPVSLDDELSNTNARRST